MRNVPSLETVHHDYAPKGVQFFYIYKALAHPETNGYVTPFSLNERLMHVKEAQRRLGSKIPWICDTMANDLKHALGNAPNSEFVIDPEGRIVKHRAWSRPAELREDLAELVGPVEPATTVAELDLKTIPPPRAAVQGVAPRVRPPQGMQPLRIEPQASLHPYYAKLRAEADQSFLQSGSGVLYLGFHLDPLYHVHWNNLAAPLQFELTEPADVRLWPTVATGPKIAAESDIDPREFLLQIDRCEVAGPIESPIELVVKYFACNDEQGWCKPVEQRYTIHLQVDRDGGRARRPGPRGRERRMPPRGNRRAPAR